MSDQGNGLVPLVVIVGIIVIALAIFGGQDKGGDRASPQTEKGAGLDVIKSMPGAQDASALTDVDPLAGFAYTNLLLAASLPCSLKDALRRATPPNASTEPESVNAALADFQNSQVARCAALMEIESLARPFVEEVVKNATAHQGDYVFSVLAPGDEVDTWTESDVGIFATLDDCQRAERTIHETDVPTRPCRAARFYLIGSGSKQQRPSVPIR